MNTYQDHIPSHKINLNKFKKLKKKKKKKPQLSQHAPACHRAQTCVCTHWAPQHQHFHLGPRPDASLVSTSCE